MRKRYRKLTNLVTTFLVGLGMLISPYGYTQQMVQDTQRRLLFDHEANTASGSEISLDGLDDELFGLKINLGNGETTITHLDVSIPGNSDLPVEFRRIATSDPNRPDFFGNPSSTRSVGLGNFHLDASYLLLPSIKASGKAGCVSDSTVVDTRDEMYVNPIVNLPGDRKLLLKTQGTSNSSYFGGNQPEYTTESNAKIKQIKKGQTCTWTLTTSEGITYEYGVVRVIKTKDGKKKHAMLVTKITDVNGNFVNYIYENSEKRLKRIKSNDGREIYMSFRSDGTVDCVFSNDSPGKSNNFIWRVYHFGTRSDGSGLKYLKSVSLPGNQQKWEFNELAGITSHYGNDYARRCTFGENARIKHPNGTVLELKTKKIVNFSQAQSPSGHLSTSHRAACLPPTDVYNNIGMHSTALRSASISDGTSIYGKFSTFFSSATYEKKVTLVDGTAMVWTIDYDEGDLFNSNFSKYSANKSVHKNQNNPVAVDITKPKKRTVTDPLGNKHVVKVGRSLNDSGLEVSREVFKRGSSTATRKVKNEYVYSTNRLGFAYNRTKLSPKSAEHWVRLSKQTITQGGVTYKTSYVYNDYGQPTKVTKSSTLQTGKIEELTTYTHNKSKWILGLVRTFSINGRPISGASYDSFGRKVLETRYGAQHMRFRWSNDGTLTATRNGNDEITQYSDYKRGVAQLTTLPNGGKIRLIVNGSGKVIQKTSPLGFIEKTTFNSLGLKTKIDLPAGFADTSIAYTLPTTTTGLIKTETTGSGSQKKIVKTTFNGYGKPLLIETRDVTARVSIFERFEYDKLGREKFKSFLSSSSSAIYGTEITYDVLGRKTQERENVAPYKTVKTNYLNRNRVQHTDPSGNVTTVHRSGYGSPDDGKPIRVDEANGRKTYKTYDKWQNLIQIRDVGGGKTYTQTFKYNSRNQLCFLKFPESEAVAREYNSIGKVSRVEVGVSDNYQCKTPVSVSISSLVPTKVCSTRTICENVGTPSRPQFVYRTVTTCTEVYRTGNTTTPVTTPTTTPSTTPTTTPTTPTPPTTPTTNPSTTPTPPECKWNEVLIGNVCRPLGPGEQVPDVGMRTGTLYYYNAFEQITKIDYPSDGTPDINFTYDLEGKVIQIVRGNVTLKYTYNKMGKRTSETLIIVETDENNKKTTKTFKGTFRFNSTGGLTSYTSPSGKVFSFTVNALNQPTSFSVGSTKYISKATYHVNGILKRALLHNTMQSKNSETMTFTNELNNRLLISATKLVDANKKIIMSFSNSYDKAERVTTVKDNRNTNNKVGDRTFTFDNMNQLKSVVGDGKNLAYAYDLFENLLSQTETFPNEPNKSILIGNEYNPSTNLVNKNLNREYRDSLIKKDSDAEVKHDKKGRVTTIGEVTLTYDNGNNIVEAQKEIKMDNGVNVITFTHYMNYNGNGDRTILTKDYLHPGKSKNDKLIELTRNELQTYFLSGQFMFRSVTEKDPIENNQIEPEPLGDKDFINFGNFITLYIDKCTQWIVNSNSNNFKLQLNPDNTVQMQTSLGPYGNRFTKNEPPETCNAVSTPSQSAPKPTPAKPAPTKTPTQPSTPEPKKNFPEFPNKYPPTYPYNPYLDESTSTLNSILSEQFENTKAHVFLSASRDSGSDLFFLRSNRYYRASIGRYLTPFTTKFRDIEPENLNLNKFVFANNNPVNFYLAVSDGSANNRNYSESINHQSLQIQETLGYYYSGVRK